MLGPHSNWVLPPQTSGSHRNRVTESWPDSLFGLSLLPHQRQGLWTAICSSLRNSSSQTSGSWLAKPEWKISGANGVAMQKPEPRTQLWSGFAALARPGQTLLPHILSHAEPGLPTPTLLSSAKHSQTHPFKGTLATLLRGEGCGTEQILGKPGGSAPCRFLQSESTILVLKWVSQHHLLLHVIPLVFWQMMKKLLLYIQCESEVL